MKEKTVTAALIQKKGRYLIGRRAATEPLAGSWEFPGGKLEPGETPEQCLVREISEELGIEIAVTSFFAESIYDYPQGRIKLLAYHCEWLKGDLEPRVHDQFEWLDPSAQLELDLLPADIPIVAALKQTMAIC